jgi:predicted HAD superfamily phosphohydrolase YqeG
MVILIDLDGTLVDTIKEKFKPYRDGLKEIDLSQVKIFPNVKEFITTQKLKGNRVIIVSDSHPKYVTKIASYLGLEHIDLMDKPNTNKFKSFLQKEKDLQSLFEAKTNFLMVGDTYLDVEFGRRLNIPTVWMDLYKSKKIDVCDGVGDTMKTLKMGPTYHVKSYEELISVIDNPYEYLYALESAFCGHDSFESIHFSEYREYKYSKGCYGIVRCLARQQDGSCDKYAQASSYLMFSNDNCPLDITGTISKCVEKFLLNLQRVSKWRWGGVN